MLIPRSPDLATQLDQSMREDLARSLERLGEMAAAVLPGGEDLQPALAHIRRQRVGPGVFARYYDLVFALQAKAYDKAAPLWREMIALAVETPEFQLLPFGPEALGEDCERFCRLLTLGQAGGPMFAPPTSAEWLGFEPRAEEALALLAQLSPAWSGEIGALLTRVIAAVPGPDARQRFAGASSFMAWGAIFINVSQERDRIQVLLSLVHEATHQLLFGLAREEPLVTNPPGERFTSPLRRDPRPMDGVFHATYVAARLSCLFEMLASGHPALTVQESAEAAGRIAPMRGRFREGHAVIASDALLTPLGRRVMEEAAGQVLAAA